MPTPAERTGAGTEGTAAISTMRTIQICLVVVCSSDVVRFWWSCYLFLVEEEEL